MSKSAKPRGTVIGAGKHIQLVKNGRWEYATRRGISGIVGIVAVTDDGKLLLVEQHRPAVGADVLELPAGLAGDIAGSEDEDLADAARRELLEETGYEAAKMRRLVAGVPSAGISDEIITLYLATGLKKTGKGEGDGSEQITVHKVPVEKVEAWLARRAKKGNMIDLKIFAGLWFARMPS